MWPNDRGEFLVELDATDELYVRKKFTLGGYTGWQAEAAERWLAQRVNARAEEHASKQLLLARGTAFWNRTRAITTMVGIAISAAWQWWPKN